MCVGGGGGGEGALVQATPPNKNPGVHPIGVREVARCIICKAIISVGKKGVMISAGPLQACTGIPSGCEAAIHAISKLFEEPEIKECCLWTL